MDVNLDQLIQALQTVQTPSTRQQRAMTLSDAATPFGCCNFFDHCTDEIMSLHYRGQLGLLDWMGFNPSDVCYRSVEFISYVRPEMSENRVATPGYLGDPCADPHGIEYGSCKITVEDFGRIGREGPTRTLMAPKYYCKTDPRRQLDGTLVTDEREWDIRFATDVLLDDVRRLLITGNAATPGQFDGLQQWVATGYDCSILDSAVIDWNGNDMDGGAGITWNGTAIGATYDIIDVMLAVYRRIRQRLMWSPVLSVLPPQVGDMILVMPSFMINCFLDFYTCWSICPGSEFNMANLGTLEARTFRNSLNGGLFGQGQVFFDGFTIPIMGYDWNMINGPTTGDIYFLTGSIASMRIWEGEFLSANYAAANFGAGGYSSIDGGRLLVKLDAENECYKQKVWMHPRLFCYAPWMQARFQDVVCNWPGGPLSPDPLETSFYPLSSFHSAECP
jgi:hypothetical protein